VIRSDISITVTMERPAVIYQYHFYCLVFTLVVVTLACSADSEPLTDADSGTDAEGNVVEIVTGDNQESETSIANGAEIDASIGDSATNTEGKTTSIGGALGALNPDWTIPEELMLCDGEACQCANGIDDDGDGEIDGFDLECTGANDDDEGTFATGIPGDNSDPKWQDCFFDGDSGSGNDRCRYHTGCMTGDKEETDPDCQVSQECIEYCLERTPNGCDCFGCCTITLDSGDTISVLITEDCDEESLDECIECVPTTDCINECGECELCPGKTIEDLPDHCWDIIEQPDGGTTTLEGGTVPGSDAGDGGSNDRDIPYTCDDDQKVCTSHGDCDIGDYCWQGCCLPVLI